MNKDLARKLVNRFGTKLGMLIINKIIFGYTVDEAIQAVITEGSE